jgi:hypothetical protein
MSDIFISYNNEDRLRAQTLAHALELLGWTIFWDRTIPYGKTWHDTIGRELGEARCVIVLWSKSSVESEWVREEADDAKQRRVLVPVRIDDVQPPIGFRSIQTADLTNWNAAESTPEFDRLIATITSRFGSAPANKSVAPAPIRAAPPRSSAKTSLHAASTSRRLADKASPSPPSQLLPEQPLPRKPESPEGLSVTVPVLGGNKGQELVTSPRWHVYLVGVIVSAAPVLGWFLFLLSRDGFSHRDGPDSIYVMVFYLFTSVTFGLIGSDVWLSRKNILALIVVWLAFFATSCLILFVDSLWSDVISIQDIPMVAMIAAICSGIPSVIAFPAYDYAHKWIG